jgi:hypothetical protein
MQSILAGIHPFGNAPVNSQVGQLIVWLPALAVYSLPTSFPQRKLLGGLA